MAAIGFDDVGRFSDANVMYTERDNKHVIANPMRSPLSGGKMNTRVFKNAKIKTGENKFNMKNTYLLSNVSVTFIYGCTEIVADSEVADFNIHTLFSSKKLRFTGTATKVTSLVLYPKGISSNTHFCVSKGK